jgi:hypothetical protein
MKGMGRTITTLLLLALASVGACGGEQTGTIGSETNWLGSCSDDSDCREGQCLCGVCTRECMTSESCLGTTTTCVAGGSESYDALCVETTTAPGGLCLESCGAGKPCAVGNRCLDGACVPDAVPPPPEDYVGRRCVDPWESQTNAAGSSQNEVTILDPDEQCDNAGYCLSFHFQGRTTCPYGGSDCLTPEGDPVTVDVRPQLVSRPPRPACFARAAAPAPLARDPSASARAALPARKR